MKIAIRGLNSGEVLKLLRGMRPRWANKFAEGMLGVLLSALAQEASGSALIGQAERVSSHINDSYVRKVTRKSRPILTCAVSEIDEVDTLLLGLPWDAGNWFQIRIWPDMCLEISDLPWRLVAATLAAAVYANDLRGRCVVDGVYDVTLRGALAWAVMGDEMPLPLIDMFQESGIMENYPCEKSEPLASGLKKKSLLESLEL